MVIVKTSFVMHNKVHFTGRVIFGVLLVLFIFFFMLPAVDLAADDVPWEGMWKGSGTANDTYLISSTDDLWALSNISNSGANLTGVHFLQTNDIDLGGVVTRDNKGKVTDTNTDKLWIPVSTTTADGVSHQFTGVYDGGGHNITHMVMTKQRDDDGFFGYIGKGGVVRYVNVIDGYVDGTYWADGIAGRNHGTIEYCSFSGDVHGSQDFVGGIVGDNHTGGVLRFCYTAKRTNPITVNGYEEYDTYVSGKQIAGGVAGRNSTGSTIENCYNTAYVTTDDSFIHNIGGITSKNEGGSTVDNCYNSGYVEGQGEVTNNVGAIVGQNSENSTVRNCYYEEGSVERGDESNGKGNDGIGTNAGTAEKVEEKTSEEFESGEVAWELSQGENGAGWGQNLSGDNEADIDKHPHFMDVQDKPRDTTLVYRVTFKYLSDSDTYDYVKYVDPEVNVNDYIPSLSGYSSDAKWYVGNEEFDGTQITKDVDAVAGIRIFFAGQAGTLTDTKIYSPEAQTMDPSMFIYYAEGGPSSGGRFEFEIINSDFGAYPNDDSVMIPADTQVGEYTLNVTVREKEPYIAPVDAAEASAKAPDIEGVMFGEFGTTDVTLNIKLVIEKATPAIVIRPEVRDKIIYNENNTLESCDLTGGEAHHPTTDTKVEGSFAWSDIDKNKVPTVTEASITGYHVTFTPTDTHNYNTAVTIVTLEIEKAESKITVSPDGLEADYNGTAQKLITNGEDVIAEGGTLKYWLAEPKDAVPDENTVFSTPFPSALMQKCILSITRS